MPRLAMDSNVTIRTGHQLAATKEPAMSVADITLSEDGLWLTAMLRPVGELAGRAIERFVDDLVDLAQRANIVVVNLVAATVPSPAALARALRRPATILSAPDKALLIVGAGPPLLDELRRQGGEIAAMA
jgi:D-serine deaminase-like pyridoxal phosphate-dependent protein